VAPLKSKKDRILSNFINNPANELSFSFEIVARQRGGTPAN
jgi:hypothetical protein